MDEREAVQRLVEFAATAMDRDGVRPAALVQAVEVAARLADELGRASSSVPAHDVDAEPGASPGEGVPTPSTSAETSGTPYPHRQTRTVYVRMDPALLRRTAPSPPPPPGDSELAIVEVPAVKRVIRPYLA